MSETTPARLIAALAASGWVEEGRGRGHVRLRWGTNPDSLVVPTDTTAPEYEAMMTAALATLERAADYGSAAERAHELATCSCGGRRWVDDENWAPEYWAMATMPRREPGDGLIPCGGCNFGGWDVEPVDVAELSDPSGRVTP
jgi:hypothetical protein